MYCDLSFANRNLSQMQGRARGGIRVLSDYHLSIGVR